MESPAKYRPRGFLILNVLRTMSISALLLSMAASTATVVKNRKKFFFFDAAAQVVLVFLCVFLISSEISIAGTYFKNNWPLFAKDSSLVSLGIAELMVGFLLLGMLNEDFAKKEIIGDIFNKLLVAAGSLVCATGAFSIFASFVFRDSRTGLTARQARSLRWPASRGIKLDSNQYNVNSKMSSPNSKYIYDSDTQTLFGTPNTTPERKRTDELPTRLPRPAYGSLRRNASACSAKCFEMNASAPERRASISNASGEGSMWKSEYHISNPYNQRVLLRSVGNLDLDLPPLAPSSTYSRSESGSVYMGGRPRASAMMDTTRGE